MERKCRPAVFASLPRCLLKRLARCRLKVSECCLHERIAARFTPTAAGGKLRESFSILKRSLKCAKAKQKEQELELEEQELPSPGTRD